MVNLGVCCASLKDAKALMKMGLGQLLVGHVNFLLGALVHGAVLRHINLHTQARAMEYAISNVIALVAGLVAVIAGISAIVLSKNKKKRPLIWVLLMFSLAAGLLATAATIGLTVSVVKAIVYSGRSLLSHCKFPDAIGFSSVTNQCPFDPTRIYGTTIILWVPLILMCVVQLVFSCRCFAVCLKFLRVRWPCRRRRRIVNARRVRVQRPGEVTSPREVTSPPPRLPVQEPTPAEEHELLNRSPPSPTDWV
ncbi:hypothetical protein COCON_G00000620 [Conger conger]|uniref:Transmembrane protein 54 n=1 Tax=Conger conger TaxID=82655 RepID=A0A9Q1E0H9_CONCO|nr:transmembrane protein 54-like [Conger conger]KAJ8287403.1 hypothetical protein COCON_G00000620 [Conger conger]